MSTITDSELDGLIADLKFLSLTEEDLHILLDKAMELLDRLERSWDHIISSIKAKECAK